MNLIFKCKPQNMAQSAALEVKKRFPSNFSSQRSDLDLETRGTSFSHEMYQIFLTTQDMILAIDKPSFMLVKAIYADIFLSGTSYFYIASICPLGYKRITIHNAISIKMSWCCSPVWHLYRLDHLTIAFLQNFQTKY